jgi:hypothetical protein
LWQSAAVRALLICLLLAGAARAQDDFEIQVYDAETAARGEAGFELHLNAFADGQSHFTLEPHVGLTGWLEAGAYVQTFLDGNDFHYGGAKLRLKGRMPRRHHGFGMALNVEWSAEPSGMGGELRPIVDFEWRRLYVALNPIVSFGPEGADFEPAVKVNVRIISALAAGVEYYGTVAAHVHRLVGVLDVGWGRLGLNVGAGYSWGDNRWLVKGIVGYAFQ